MGICGRANRLSRQGLQFTSTKTERSVITSCPIHHFVEGQVLIVKNYSFLVVFVAVAPEVLVFFLSGGHDAYQEGDEARLLEHRR
jgi:hypothetical protein